MTACECERASVCAHSGCHPPSTHVDVIHVIQHPTPPQLVGAIVLQQRQTGVIKAERGGGRLDGKRRRVQPTFWDTPGCIGWLSSDTVT